MSQPSCESTMTLGGPYDEVIAAILEEDYQPLPVHHCEKEPGHKDEHSADGFTWTAVTITAPLTI